MAVYVSALDIFIYDICDSLMKNGFTEMDSIYGKNISLNYFDLPTYYNEICSNRYDTSSLTINGKHIDENDVYYIKITVSKMYDIYNEVAAYIQKQKEGSSLKKLSEHIVSEPPIRLNIECSVNSNNSTAKYRSNIDLIRNSWCAVKDGTYSTIQQSSQNDTAKIGILASKSFFIDYDDTYNGSKYEHTLNEVFEIGENSHIKKLTPGYIVYKTLETVQLCKDNIDKIREMSIASCISEPDYKLQENDVNFTISRNFGEWWTFDDNGEWKDFLANDLRMFVRSAYGDYEDYNCYHYRDWDNPIDEADREYRRRVNEGEEEDIYDYEDNFPPWYC